MYYVYNTFSGGWLVYVGRSSPTCESNRSVLSPLGPVRPVRDALDKCRLHNNCWESPKVFVRLLTTQKVRRCRCLYAQQRRCYQISAHHGSRTHHVRRTQSACHDSQYEMRRTVYSAIMPGRRSPDQQRRAGAPWASVICENRIPLTDVTCSSSSSLFYWTLLAFADSLSNPRNLRGLLCSIAPSFASGCSTTGSQHLSFMFFKVGSPDWVIRTLSTVQPARAAFASTKE